MTHQPPLKASHAWMSQGNDLDDTRTDCQSCANIKRAVSRAREEFSQLTECAKFGHWLFSYFSWRKRMPSAYNIFTIWNSLAAAEIQCIQYFLDPFVGIPTCLFPAISHFPCLERCFAQMISTKSSVWIPLGWEGVGYMRAWFSREKLFMKRSLDTQELLHREVLTQRRFTHRSFYPQTRVQTEGFTDRGSYAAQKLLHRAAFTHRSFDTKKPLHREVFTPEAFTQKSLYTEKFLHTEAFAQENFYAGKLLHRSFVHWAVLHRGAFTHRRVYTEKPLHRGTFTHRSLLRKKTICTK